MASEVPLGAEIPLDADGFCISFAATDKVGIQGFLKDYGFVIVQDALSAAECDATLQELWRMGAGEDGVPVDPDQPQTWNRLFDAGKNPIQWQAVFGKTNLMSPQLLENRQSPRVHQAYAAIMGTDELIVDHDRLGVMRPTVAVDLADGLGPRDRLDWRSKSNWLHIDFNPVSESPMWPPITGPWLGHTTISGNLTDNGDPVDFEKTFIPQGFLMLTDSTVDDGGFHCVPGSHKMSKEWAREHVIENSISGKRELKWRSLLAEEDDDLMELTRKVPVRRGSLLVWDARTFHGNYPNESKGWRVVQYMRMLANAGNPYGPIFADLDGRHEDNSRIYPAEFKPTQLGARLFGMEPWPTSAESIVPEKRGLAEKRGREGEAETTEQKKAKPE